MKKNFKVLFCLIIFIAISFVCFEKVGEVRYEKQFTQSGSQIVESLRNFDGLMDKDLANSKDREWNVWIEEIRTQLIKIQKSTEEIGVLNPPIKYREVHKYVLLAVDEFSEATRLIPKSAEELDSELLKIGMAHLTKGTEALKKVSEIKLIKHED